MKIGNAFKMEIGKDRYLPFSIMRDITEKNVSEALRRYKISKCGAGLRSVIYDKLYIYDHMIYDDCFVL